MAHTGPLPPRHRSIALYTEGWMNPMLTDCCIHRERMNELKLHSTNNLMALGFNLLNWCHLLCLSVRLSVFPQGLKTPS